MADAARGSLFPVKLSCALGLDDVGLVACDAICRNVRTG